MPEAGHYAQKQLGARSWFVSWSHGSRYRMGRKLVQPFVGCRFLDYGCGDGTFMNMVRDLFPQAVGADLDESQLADCRRRFADAADISFVLTQDLAGVEHLHAYGLITCMEVLEHCPEPALIQVLDHLMRLVKPDGHVLISVPMEIGLSLVAKQVLRRLAAWRGDTAYRQGETYGWTELCQQVCASSRTAIERPILGTTCGQPYHGHKGFNWRALRLRLQERFQIQKTYFTPVPWLGGWLNSQVWFLCSPRGEAQSL